MTLVSRSSSLQKLRLLIQDYLQLVSVGAGLGLAMSLSDEVPGTALGTWPCSVTFLSIHNSDRQVHNKTGHSPRAHLDSAQPSLEHACVHTHTYYVHIHTMYTFTQHYLCTHTHTTPILTYTHIMHRRSHTQWPLLLASLSNSAQAPFKKIGRKTETRTRALACSVARTSYQVLRMVRYQGQAGGIYSFLH